MAKSEVPWTRRGINASGLDQMSSDELRELLAQKNMELMTARAKSDRGMPVVAGVQTQKEIRKTRARIMTILVRRGERCVA